jgi:hypothetical protein
VKTKFIVSIILLLVIGICLELVGPPFQRLRLDLIFLLSPLFISIFILTKFRKDDAAKYVGILSLKPMLTAFLFYFIGKLDLYGELNNLYPYNIVRAVLWIVPELFLTFVIVLLFRKLIQRDGTVLLFLIGDIVRWLCVFISLLFPDIYPEPFFYWQLYLEIFFGFLFPQIYATGGLILLIGRSKQNQLTVQKEAKSIQ